MGLFKKSLIVCALFLLCFSCRKSTSANWDIDATLPVVNSLLDIKNFVNDSLFQADNTGLLYVRLNRQVAAIKLDSLLVLPDTVISQSFVNTSPFTFTIFPGQPINTVPSSELQFNLPNNIALKRVDVHQGILSVKFSNNLTEPLDLTYRIDGATKNGQSLTISETIPPGNNSLQRSYDLSGYSLDLRGASSLVYNTIVQTYTVALSTTASGSTTVSNNGGASLEVSYSKIAPEYVEGYFGNQVITIKQDTARLGLSGNFRASNFMLSDASMDFTILNEFGADFRASLNNNKSISTPNNNTVLLNTNQLSNVNINRAIKSGSLTPSVKVISFNSANSNITSFVSNLPDKLSYEGSVEVNPLGNISGYNDFAYYNTGIRILANINIPLKFTADYFELQTHNTVDFSNVSQLNKVNYGNFEITASNGFPFSVRLQAYMLDAQNNVLDSVFLPGANIIAGGSLDNNNIVLQPNQERLKVPVDRSKIEHLRSCKNIKIVSRFIMPLNPPAIQILENYQVKVNIVANVNYNVGLGG